MFDTPQLAAGLFIYYRGICRMPKLAAVECEHLVVSNEVAKVMWRFLQLCAHYPGRVANRRAPWVPKPDASCAQNHSKAGKPVGSGVIAVRD